MPRAKAHAYRGRENEREVVPAGSIQAAQLTAAIRLAYCQPGVGAFFNFMLADEHDLAGWQSGLLWADLTRKPSFGAVAAVVRQVAAGAVDCGSAAA